MQANLARGKKHEKTPSVCPSDAGRGFHLRSTAPPVKAAQTWRKRLQTNLLFILTFFSRFTPPVSDQDAQTSTSQAVDKLGERFQGFRGLFQPRGFCTKLRAQIHQLSKRDFTSAWCPPFPRQRPGMELEARGPCRNPNGNQLRCGRGNKRGGF